MLLKGCLGPAKYCDHHDIWFEPEVIKYREIQGWPHLNACVTSLEILNIGKLVTKTSSLAILREFIVS